MEFDKVVVYDDRVMPLKPNYAIVKGGASITSSKNLAISASNSQHLFTVNPPSQKTYVDRKVSWSSDVYLKVDVAGKAGAGASTRQVLIPGLDFALCAFPLQSMCSNVSVNINNQQITFNTSEMLNEVLHLTNLRKNLQMHQCASMLDNAVQYKDMTGTIGNVIASYNESIPLGDSPNGAHVVYFTRPDGTVLTGTDHYNDTFGGVNYVVNYTNGIPVYAAAGGGLVPNLSGDVACSLYLKFTSTEPLVLPPFCFNDVHENHQPLFGVSNMKFTFNIAGAGRVLRNDDTKSEGVITNVAFNANRTTAFNNSNINVIYITPPLSLPLPSKSVIPIHDFVRFVGSTSDNIPAKTARSAPLSSQSIQLSGVPDMILVYAKPRVYNNTGAATYTEADWHLSITGLNVNFDNRSGLMTTFSENQLYEMSVNNGLDNMDWHVFHGQANTSSKGVIALNGPIVVLKPGVDFELPPDLASGVGGKFEITIQANVYNQASFQANDVQLNVIAIHSGFFVTENGNAMVNICPISLEDVVNPDEKVATTQASVQRYVGGGLLNKLSNIVSKGVSVYSKTKPVVSAIKQMLPEGQVKAGLSAIGYGKPKGKKSAASRLL